MKRLVSAVWCVCIFCTCLSAEIQNELSKILPGKTVAELLQTGSVQNSAYRKNSAVLTLVPHIPVAMDADEIRVTAISPFFIESLYLYKKPVVRITAPGGDVNKISIILRSLSKLEGIEYYSTSRKKMRTLYEKSYVVDGEKERNRVSDPVQGSADGLSLNVVQKDLTFGQYLYRYRYRQTDDTVAFFSMNLEAMNYGFVKILAPENLHVSLIVHDLGDCFLIYGLTTAKFLAIPGLERKLNASFTTRADAIFHWFINEYEK